MGYATEADIIALHSEDALNRLADLDGNGTRDEAKITRALDDAQALIDGYIAVRVALPISPVPAILKNLSVDIAVYRMASDGGLLSEDMRTRYEDAISFLRDLAAGKATLPIPRINPGDTSTSAVSGPLHAVVDSAPRLFDRRGLRSL